MSLVTVCPNIDLNLQHRDIHLISPTAVTVRTWVATSSSNNVATFSMPPPSTSVFIDRCFMLSLPITVVYTGTTTGSALLETSKDALRAYPISSVINNVNLVLNNISFSFQTSDYVANMARFWKESKLSGFPSFMDQYQNYSDGVGAVNNPLGSYFNAVGLCQPRGGYPMTIVNGATSATLTSTVFEPIFMPPLNRCTGEGLGFTGIKTIDLTINYAANLTRIISHSTNSLATLTNVVVTLGQPIVYNIYSSPPLDYVPRPLEYMTDSLNRFVTPVGAPLAPNAVFTMTSTNMQLNAVPKWMLIFCREANSNLTYTSTDTVLNISNLAINFDNVAGQLSSASEFDLWRLSAANGLQSSWEQWHGTTPNISAGTQLGTIGSYLKLYFGKDITLKSTVYPGSVGAFNLQFNITVKNVNQTQTIQAPQLYVITSTAQKLVMTPDGYGTQILGVTQEGPTAYIPFDVANKFYGGSFKDWLGKIGHYLQKAHQYVRENKLVSGSAKLIPNAMVKTLGEMAEHFGYGEGEGGEGGEGGRMASKSDLMRRIRNARV